MWSSFFDKIYLISLPINGGTSRLIKSLRQLTDNDISGDIWEATYNENSGVIGLRDTMIRLFHECLENKYDNVLVLEDDINIVGNLNYYMPKCLDQLPKDYDLLYLGAYVVRPFKERYSENLLLLDKALTTHAVAYPKKTIETLLPIFEEQSNNPRDTTSIDMTILNRIISKGKSYITYPLLVSQQSGYSTIEKKEVDYEKYIEQEYKNQIKKLSLS